MLRRELQDFRGVATVLGLLGDVARGQGDRHRAEGLYQEGLGIATRLGAGRQIAVCRDGLAKLADFRKPTLLTHREREVAGLIAQGLKNREIAEMLIVSERTVHSHVRSILSKLDLSSRAQVAVFAVERLC